MSLLNVALEDGFVDDTVIVRVGGVERYRRAGVSTRFQIGLADEFDVEVDAVSTTVDVDLPDRGVRGTVDVDLTRVQYVGVSHLDDRITFRTAAEPFGYA